MEEMANNCIQAYHHGFNCERFIVRASACEKEAKLTGILKVLSQQSSLFRTDPKLACSDNGLKLIQKIK
jgi:hypothetical protein